MLRNIKANILQKMYDNDNSVNLFNGRDFLMSGLGEKNKFAGVAKHLKRTLKYSKQRITKGYCSKDVHDMTLYLDNIIYNMLVEFRTKHNSSPGYLSTVNEDGTLSDDGSKKWNEILDTMIYLLKESNEDTCSMVNPYKEDYENTLNKFTEKYGMFGEKLLTEEEIKEKEKTGNVRLHTMTEIPENKEIWDKYFEKEKEIEKYRKRCRKNFFMIFEKCFDDLWY